MTLPVYSFSMTLPVYSFSMTLPVYSFSMTLPVYSSSMTLPVYSFNKTLLRDRSVHAGSRADCAGYKNGNGESRILTWHTFNTAHCAVCNNRTFLLILRKITSFGCRYRHEHAKNISGIKKQNKQKTFIYFSLKKVHCTNWEFMNLFLNIMFCVRLTLFKIFFLAFFFFFLFFFLLLFSG